MNYFDLVNKCLAELNYKQVNAFSELTKNDHKKIKNIINLVNNEVCNYDNWNFKLRKATLNLPAGSTEIDNTIYGIKHMNDAVRHSPIVCLPSEVTDSA